MELGKLGQRGPSWEGDWGGRAEESPTERCRKITVRRREHLVLQPRGQWAWCVLCYWIKGIVFPLNYSGKKKKKKKKKDSTLCFNLSMASQPGDSKKESKEIIFQLANKKQQHSWTKESWRKIWDSDKGHSASLNCESSIICSCFWPSNWNRN